MASVRLAVQALGPAPQRPDGRHPGTRTVMLASSLADLCAAGLPLDSPAVCAGVVAEVSAVQKLQAPSIR
jgi:hypothetical protein